MYLLIDIGNTRIKWQQRDDKDIKLTGSILVEEFMDIDFSTIKTVEKIIISNVNHSIVMDKLKEILSKMIQFLSAYLKYGVSFIKINFTFLGSVSAKLK